MAERPDPLVARNKGYHITGVVLVALAAFLVLSLATHSPQDPPNSSQAGQPAMNRAGWLGAHVSYGLLTAVGHAAYVLPLLSVLWAWNRFRRRPWKPYAARSLGIAGIALFLCVGSGLLDWSRYTAFAWGGWLGTWTSAAVLVPFTGRIGSAILLIGLLGVSLVLATDIDPRRWAQAWAEWRRRRRSRRARARAEAEHDPWEEEPSEPLEGPGRPPAAGEEGPARESPMEVSMDAPPERAAPSPPPEEPQEPEAPGRPVALMEEDPLPEVVPPEDGAAREQPLPVVEEPPPSRRVRNGSAGNGRSRPARPAPLPGGESPESGDSASGAAAAKPRPRIRRYRPPGTRLLDPVPADRGQVDRETLLENARVLQEAMANFDVMGKVVEVSPGPVVTRYEVEPAAGVKVGRISALADDLARVMSAEGIRIQAPVPGKSVVGVEIANQSRETVYLREIVESRAFRRDDSELAMALGKTISGETYVTDLARMPHLLVAGATGSGKSVCINTLICSLLLRASPDEVRLLMVDPKVVELTIYNDIPHLLVPVITEPKKAAEALRWAVAEMEARYQLLARMAVRNLADYNAKVERILAGGAGAEGTAEGEEVRKLPYIVIVIDEFADLMLTAPADVEASLMGLAQKSRAVGIHIILATQRPSVNVITGVIKANFPSRIAFLVASKTDSRTILDMNGAERLLGRGDMLFLRSGHGEPIRIHGAFISGEETERLVEQIRNSGYQAEEVQVFSARGGSAEDAGDRDELFDEAVAIVLESRQASTSYLQRRMKVGYSRAARLMDELELAGIVGPAEGAKPRRILAEGGDDPADEEAS